jgi:hypothetical protein
LKVLVLAACTPLAGHPRAGLKRSQPVAAVQASNGCTRWQLADRSLPRPTAPAAPQRPRNNDRRSKTLPEDSAAGGSNGWAAAEANNLLPACLCGDSAIGVHKLLAGQRAGGLPIAFRRSKAQNKSKRRSACDA